MCVSPQDWAEYAEALIAAGDRAGARRLLEEYFAGPVQGVTEYKIYATAPMRVMTRLLLHTGESDAAYAFAERATKDKRSCPADQELYGVILASMGRMAEAKAIYKQLTNGLPPGVPYANELKAAIEKNQ